MKKERQSNFELMRIVSMFFIVGWHFLLHGGILDNSTGITNYIVIILSALFMVHVNSFVLLTGYFNYNKEFKFSRIVKINNSRLFYNIVIVVLFLLLGTVTESKLFMLKILSPIPRFWDHWFLVAYMLLYLISPILNRVINGFSKETLKKIIIALLIVSFLAYFTKNEFYFMNNGFSLVSFTMLYFIGVYLHKYPINLSEKKSKRKLMSISLIMYIVLSLCNVIIYYFGKSFLCSSHEIVRYYADMLYSGFSYYTNPFVIFGSIFYFMVFSQINIKNTVINFFGKYILGAYLITEHEFIRPRMYKFLGFKLDNYTIKHVLIALGLSIAIMIVCALIEFLRTKVFEFFYKRKFAKKLRDKIQKIIYNVGLNVKW